MAAIGSPSAKAEALLEQIRPELLKLLDNAPPFGRWSISGTMRRGRLTSTDIGVEIKHDLDTDPGRPRG